MQVPVTNRQLMLKLLKHPPAPSASHSGTQKYKTYKFKNASTPLHQEGERFSTPKERG